MADDSNEALARAAVQAGYLSWELAESLLRELAAAAVTMPGAPLPSFLDLCRQRNLITPDEAAGLTGAAGHAAVPPPPAAAPAGAAAAVAAMEDVPTTYAQRGPLLAGIPGALPPAPAPPPPTGRLVQETGSDAGRVLLLFASAVLGRQVENEVPIADHLASRRHAWITFDAQSGRHVLTDLKSANHTFVNETPLTGPHTLLAGQRIRIGETVFRYEPATGSEARGIAAEETMAFVPPAAPAPGPGNYPSSGAGGQPWIPETPPAHAPAPEPSLFGEGGLLVDGDVCGDGDLVPDAPIHGALDPPPAAPAAPPPAPRPGPAAHGGLDWKAGTRKITRPTAHPPPVVHQPAPYDDAAAAGGPAPAYAAPRPLYTAPLELEPQAPAGASPLAAWLAQAAQLHLQRIFLSIAALLGIVGTLLSWDGTAKARAALGAGVPGWLMLLLFGLVLACALLRDLDRPLSPVATRAADLPASVAILLGLWELGRRLLVFGGPDYVGFAPGGLGNVGMGLYFIIGAGMAIPYILVSLGQSTEAAGRSDAPRDGWRMP
ncbi:MAG: FHA domain-containing protein [Planctomycetes bacterium]|nr:FHA domain-containing protein [Planctomycetota bacterium]